jgi:hypothetical protein
LYANWNRIVLVDETRRKVATLKSGGSYAIPCQLDEMYYAEYDFGTKDRAIAYIQERAKEEAIYTYLMINPFQTMETTTAHKPPMLLALIGIKEHIGDFLLRSSGETQLANKGDLFSYREDEPTVGWLACDHTNSRYQPGFIVLNKDACDELGCWDTVCEWVSILLDPNR